MRMAASAEMEARYEPVELFDFLLSRFAFARVLLSDVSK